ncbi:hypothetical protein Pst134EA_018909 [Puccinia striiformis f. sp. tritici]|uniref:hypothetical protein n=1 Tax=Puccinia striiformis f. sp. tritici TaxID=168172 RepID=UPI002008532A|nr:hypothetical protein Pst134EA_018909 [Puccinia striiformis f. sp. tritici]KAH9458752.1 hypothetical protein Pst134EA_018909 [Puccinia striiformis f. sp. tritici]
MMTSGSRSELPSSEPLVRVNPRGGSSTTLADPTGFVSRSSSLYSTISGVISRVPSLPTQPDNQQLRLGAQTKSFLRPSYEYEQSPQSPSSRSAVVGSEAEDDLTSPLNLTRNTDHTTRELGLHMNTGIYHHGTEMIISGSHLDRQINSFIQETAVMSPELAETTRRLSNSSDRHESRYSDDFSPEQPSDIVAEDTGDDPEGDSQSSAPPSDLKMAGSRPPSRACSVRRRSRAPSACSSSMGGEEDPQVPGYLFLHEVPPLRIKKSTSANHPSVNSSQEKGKARSHPRAPSDQRAAHHQRPEVQQGRQSHLSSRVKSGMGSTHAENDLEAIDVFKSPQHAWYLIRRLVGLELRWEAARAWKLTDLSLNSVNPSKEPIYHASRERSEDDKSAYSWDSSSGETTIAAENLPILRYLIQNFLLTLPIIRDTVSVVQNVPHSPHFNPQVSTNQTSVAVYWTAGVLPILRRLHQSNLSAAIDLGSPGFLHILFDCHIARLLERFVATGLKLCTQRLNSPRSRPTTNPAICGAEGLALEGNRAPLRGFDHMRSLEGNGPSTTKVTTLESPESEVAPGSQQAGKPLAPGKLLSNRAPGQKTSCLKNITPRAGSHAQDPDAPDHEQPRTYSHNFEKEPQRYSGISVQPSQRASIGIITPSNSNCIPDSAEAHHLGHPEAHSAGFLTHEGRRTSATPSDTPSSKTFSSSSTYDRHPTDTEVSTFMPSVFGSMQESPLTPWTIGFNQPDVSASKINPTDSFSYRKSVPPILTTSEEVKSVRQTIERMKMERHNLDDHRHDDDNKSNAPSRLSRKFSWIRPNNSKVGPSNDPDVNERVSANNDFRRNPMVSEEACIPHTPTLNKPFHPKNIKEVFNGSEVKGAMSHGATQAISRRGSRYHAPDKNNSIELLGNPELEETDAHTDSKRASIPKVMEDKVRKYTRHVFASVPRCAIIEVFSYLNFSKCQKNRFFGPGRSRTFWKGTPVHKLSWGGFEVDLVGIRRGVTKNSYVIRVRRPSRLDEYVLRKESQFKDYYRRLSKDFPNAHIRAVPSPEISLEDDLFSLDALLQEDGQQPTLAERSDGFDDGLAPRKSTETRIMLPLTEHGPSLSGNPCFVDPFSALPLDQAPAIAHDGYKRRATLASIFGVGNHKSKFSVDTRSDWNGSNKMGKKPTEVKNERAHVDREIVGSSKKSHHPGHSRRGSLRQIKVSPDTHRRALRGWLRDTLSIRTVGHHPETAAFLLLGSVVPEEKDLIDIRQRETIDEERRKRRVQVAQGAAERSKTIHEWWSDVKNEFVNGEGVENFSKALKQGTTIEELPVRFQKALEWIRMNVAEGLHELLVIGNQSDILFGKLLGLNAALPWSLIKNVLKIKKPHVMSKALLEVFLAKKLNMGKSKHSVIQRLMEIAINETEGNSFETERRIQACRARIQSLTMCEKIIKFVHASKDLKNLFRQYSESADMELVVAIVRSAEEPRLDKYDLERIMSASKAYKSLLAKNRNRITSSMTENIHVRLILDLKLYLRLISQERDSKQIRKMLSEESVAEAMEVLISPPSRVFKANL